MSTRGNLVDSPPPNRHAQRNGGSKRTSRRLLAAGVAALVTLWAHASLADNPIIQTKYTADPAPLVYEDTVYLYTSHDEDNAVGFTMYNWMLYTSSDLVNWTDHGMIGGVKDPYKTFKWSDGVNAWAPQVIARNGKFYLYAPFPKGGHMVIGVAVADQPTGPFVDALGQPLIDNPNSSNDIDPTVFVTDDGQGYLYWGHQPSVFYVKLNQDMISYSGSIVQVTRPQTYEEGPWFFQRNGQYYLAFASTCCPEGIGYARSSSATGPWTFAGSIMDGNAKSSGNHPGIIDFKDGSYVFGFDYAVQLEREGSKLGERRSVCVEKFEYGADGSIPKLPFWSDTGAPQLGTLNPYVKTEAETIAWAWDVKTETCSEGGMDVTDIQNGDYIKVKGVDFGTGAQSLDVRAASAGNGGKIEVHLDTQTGKLVGTCAVAGTGGAQTWATTSCAIDGTASVHDLFLVFTGGSGSLFNFNWWMFHGSSGDGMPAGGAAGMGGSPATAGAAGAGIAGGTGRGGAGGGGISGVSGVSGSPAAGAHSDGGRTGLGGNAPMVAGAGAAGASAGAHGGAPGAEAGGQPGGAPSGQLGGAPGTGGSATGAAGLPNQTTVEHPGGCGCSVPRADAGRSTSLGGLASLLGLHIARLRWRRARKRSQA